MKYVLTYVVMRKDNDVWVEHSNTTVVLDDRPAADALLETALAEWDELDRFRVDDANIASANHLTSEVVWRGAANKRKRELVQFKNALTDLAENTKPAPLQKAA